MNIRKPVLIVGKHGLIYGLGNILSKVTIFFLIPIYTNYLTTKEVGILALIEMTEMFFITIGSSAIYQSTWYKLSLNNKDSHSKIIFSGYMGLIISNIVLLVLLSFFMDGFYQFLGFSKNTGYSIGYLVLINILLQFGGTFTLALWQYQQKSIPFIILSIFQLIGILAFSIYFVVFQSMGIFGIILGKFIVVLSIFIFSTIFLIKKYYSIPSFKIFYELIKFGYPLIFIGLATPILNVSDRYFLNLFVPLSQIGIYSINYKFGMLINMFLIVPLQRGLLPMIYRQGLKDEMRSIYKDVLFYYLIIGCFFILGVTFFIEPIITWISSPEYTNAAYVVPFISTAYLIAGFRTFFLPLIALKDRTDLLGKIAVIGIAVCLSLNYVLIRQFGIDGAVAATVFSYLIFTLSLYYLTIKVEVMDWGWPRIGKVVALTSMIISGVHLVGNQWNSFEWISGLIGFISFPVLLWAFRIIGEREINGVKSIISFLQNKVKSQ